VLFSAPKSVGHPTEEEEKLQFSFPIDVPPVQSGLVDVKMLPEEEVLENSSDYP
jgi:hypothetical protein